MLQMPKFMFYLKYARLNNIDAIFSSNTLPWKLLYDYCYGMLLFTKILCLNTFFSFQHFRYEYHSLYCYTLCYGKPVLVLYWIHKQYVKWLVVEFQCSSRVWCGKPVVLEYQKMNFAIESCQFHATLYSSTL